MKKLLPMLLLSVLLLSGCAEKGSSNSIGVETNQRSESMSSSEQAEEPKRTEEPKQVEEPERKEEPEQAEEPEQEEQPEQTDDTKKEDDASSQQSLSEKIAVVISSAEEQDAAKLEQMQEAQSQMELNMSVGEWDMVWYDALDAVWELLEANLNEEDMEALRQAQREWITYKEAEMKAAGAEYEGGSMQPMVESLKGAELTKARVYELAEYAAGK